MGNAISIVYDYLSSIKSKLPSISTGSEKHVFVDGDTLYIQFIKNGDSGDKEFNIVYANLQNNAKLSTHFFLLNDNESYKENDFVELRFAEDHFERRRCMCSKSLDMVREFVPGFEIKSDVSSVPKKDEKVVLNEDTERVLVLKAPEYAIFVVLALMRIIGLAITQKVVKGMTLAKLLTMLRIANKLKIMNTDGSIDAPSTFFFVAKSMDLKLAGAEILDSNIGEATITSGKLVSATADSTVGRTSLLDSAAAETLNYAALKKKDLAPMDASLNKIFAGQDSYHIHAMKDIEKMGSVKYIPSYIIETFEIVKGGLRALSQCLMSYMAC